MPITGPGIGRRSRVPTPSPASWQASSSGQAERHQSSSAASSASSLRSDFSSVTWPKSGRPLKASTR